MKVFAFKAAPFICFPHFIRRVWEFDKNYPILSDWWLHIFLTPQAPRCPRWRAPPEPLHRSTPCTTTVCTQVSHISPPPLSLSVSNTCCMQEVRWEDMTTPWACIQARPGLASTTSSPSTRPDNTVEEECQAILLPFSHYIYITDRGAIAAFLAWDGDYVSLDNKS